MKVVMGLSGGMDSTTLLGMLLSQGNEVHVCSFYYGSKHNKWEGEAVRRILSYYKNFPVVYHVFNLEPAFSEMKSDLLSSGGPIPEGHYEEESMRRTVVPGRNSIFITVMAGLAESIDADRIALGIHSGDHHIYPDCRKEYIKAMDSAIYLATDRKVQIITPLIDDDKTSILRWGYLLDPKVPYQYTRTCYKDQKLACGKCGSCVERLEAFTNIGYKDPVKYER